MHAIWMMLKGEIEVIERKEEEKKKERRGKKNEKPDAHVFSLFLFLFLLLLLLRATQRPKWNE